MSGATPVIVRAYWDTMLVSHVHPCLYACMLLRGLYYLLLFWLLLLHLMLSSAASMVVPEAPAVVLTQRAASTAVVCLAAWLIQAIPVAMCNSSWDLLPHLAA